MFTTLAAGHTGTPSCSSSGAVPTGSPLSMKAVEYSRNGDAAAPTRVTCTPRSVSARSSSPWRSGS